MKTKSLLTAIAFASAVSGAQATTEHSTASERLLNSPAIDLASVQHLDPVELEDTRAGFPLMAFAFGVASLDLAVLGLYYGVYVPYYAPQDPSFNYNLP